MIKVPGHYAFKQAIFPKAHWINPKHVQAG